MKKYFVAAVLCLLAGAAIFFIRVLRQDAPSATNAASESTARPSLSTAAGGKGFSTIIASNTSIANPASGQQQDLAAQAGQYIAPADPPTNLPPETILQNLRRVLHQYGEMFGGDPVGTNPEITAALSGKNPKQIDFLTGQPGVRIDADGELIDSWGTPYFFHQLSGTEMEIHSAGPDKMMWTSDDLVAR
ncbi:MAG: hypothetical protein ACLQVW_30175 [Limisphaerales bacterium]